MRPARLRAAHSARPPRCPAESPAAARSRARSGRRPRARRSRRAAAFRRRSAAARAGSACESGSPTAGRPGSGTSPARIGVPPYERGLGHGDRRQQRLRVRMARLREQRALVGELDDPAEVHHGDPRRDELDDREIVRDEDVGQPEPLLQVAQQVHDLRLDRDVERGHRLVADDEARLDGERAGDADALPLAAGELVRVAPGVFRRESDESQQLRARARVGARPRGRAASSGSASVCPTVMRGLSEANGSWKMICSAPRRPRMSRIGQREEVAAFEVHGARGRLEQAQHEPAGRRFAAARFADERQRLADGDLEAHAVDRPHHAA